LTNERSLLRQAKAYIVDAAHEWQERPDHEVHKLLRDIEAALADEPTAECTCEGWRHAGHAPYCALAEPPADPDDAPDSTAQFAQLVADAARYRYLRADNAFEPEERAVRGGKDLDELCDAGIRESAENRSDA